jgi:hypothetical protein
LLSVATALNLKWHRNNKKLNVVLVIMVPAERGHFWPFTLPTGWGATPFSLSLESASRELAARNLDWARVTDTWPPRSPDLSPLDYFVVVVVVVVVVSVCFV